MSTMTRTPETTSKWWLIGLAAAVLVSLAVLAHSFLSTFSPTEEHIEKVQRPASEATRSVVTRTEPAWDGAQSAGGIAENQLAPAKRTSPFEAEENTEQQARAALQTQAKYFQKVMVNGKLPASLGSLTKEQVDDLQKKGLIIE
jgi:hypothetical protein